MPTRKKEENKKRGTANSLEKVNSANKHTTYLLYSTDLENVKQTLKSDGWEEIDSGGYQSHREIRPYNYTSIYHKAVKTDKNTDCENDKLSCAGGCMTSGGGAKPAPALEKVRGQISTYGPKGKDLTLIDTDTAPAISFRDIPSIAELRDNCSDALVIGYDSEWQEVRGARFILSWQFACFWKGCLHTFLVLTTCISRDEQWAEKSNLRLRLHHMLSVILHFLGYGKPCDYRNIYCYKCLVRPEIGNVPDELVFDTKSEALEHAVYEYTKSGEVSQIEISDKTPEKRKVRREIRDEVWAKNRVYP